jgi:rod shape-determining protein MreD
MIFRFLRVFAVFVFATLLHWVFVEIFSPLDINVGIMLVFTLITASCAGRAGVYTFAFFCGLFLDFFANAMFGGYALTFTLAVFAFSKIENKIDFREAGPQIVLTCAMNMAATLVYGVFGKIFTGAFLWQGFKSFLLGSIITGLLMPVMYLFIVKYFMCSSGGKANEKKSII